MPRLSDGRAVAIYCLDLQNRVTRHTKERVLEFGDLQEIAVVPALSVDLDVITMDRSMFKGVSHPTRRSGPRGRACV